MPRVSSRHSDPFRLWSSSFYVRGTYGAASRRKSGGVGSKVREKEGWLEPALRVSEERKEVECGWRRGLTCLLYSWEVVAHMIRKLDLAGSSVSTFREVLVLST